ncbi:MAG: hypothetical protein ACREUZ_23230 [Burkholderiales bacterium]
MKATTHSRTASKRRKTTGVRAAAIARDVNMEAAGLLHDMALLQPNERSQLGSKRAARAVVALPMLVTDLVEAGTLRDVPFIGPSRARILTERQDIDYGLAMQALDAGCLFALDSDAHSIGELRFTDYAIAHARLAGVPSDRVINCWSDERLDEWMEERRG